MTRLLDEHIQVLCHDHLRRTKTTDGDVYGQEPALLAQLSGAVANGSDQRTGRGSGGTGAPVNLAALDLLNEIKRIVDDGWPYRGNPGMIRVDVRQKLNAWANTTTEPLLVGRLTELCGGWVVSIREMLEPRVKLTLTGCCPECGHGHVYRDDEDGSVTYQPALVAYEAYATCRACTHVWEGKDMHVLAARIVA